MKRVALCLPVGSNSCWLNAVVVMLDLTFPEIWDWIIIQAFQLSETPQAGKALAKNAVAMEFANLGLEARENPANPEISKKFRNLVEEYIFPLGPQERSGCQRDAAEFLWRLAEYLETQQNLFLSSVHPQVKCNACNDIIGRGAVRRTVITVPSSDEGNDDGKTLFEAAMSSLEDQDTCSFECSNEDCDSEKCTKHGFSKTRLARLIVLRIEKGNRAPLPDEVTFKNYRYELSAVICHEGPAPSSGHYTTFSRNQGRWYKCEGDIAVKDPKRDLIVVVLYKRIDTVDAEPLASLPFPVATVSESSKNPLPNVATVALTGAKKKKSNPKREQKASVPPVGAISPPMDVQKATGTHPSGNKTQSQSSTSPTGSQDSSRTEMSLDTFKGANNALKAASTTSPSSSTLPKASTTSSSYNRSLPPPSSSAPVKAPTTVSNIGSTLPANSNAVSKASITSPKHRANRPPYPSAAPVTDDEEVVNLVDSPIRPNSSPANGEPSSPDLGVFIHHGSETCSKAIPVATDGICHMCGAEEGSNFYACSTHRDILLCGECFQQANLPIQMSEGTSTTLRDFLHFVLPPTTWWTDNVVTVMLANVFHSRSSKGKLHLVSALACAMNYVPNKPFRTAKVIPDGKRFVLRPFVDRSHFVLTLIGRENVGDVSSFTCWYFDSLNKGLTDTLRQFCAASGCSEFITIPCPQQFDAVHCGPLTVQNAGVVLDVLALHENDAFEVITAKLQQGLRSTTVEAPQVRASAIEYYVRCEGLCQSLTSVGSRQKQNNMQDPQLQIAGLLSKSPLANLEVSKAILGGLSSATLASFRNSTDVESSGKVRAADSSSDSKTQDASSSSTSKARAADSSSDSKTQGASSSSASKARASDSSSDSKTQGANSSSASKTQGASSSSASKARAADSSSDSKTQGASSSSASKARASDSSSDSKTQGANSSSASKARASDSSSDSKTQGANSSSASKTQDASSSSTSKARAADSSSDSKTQGASSSSASKARASDSSSDSKTQGANSSSASKTQGASSSSASKARAADSSSDSKTQDASSSSTSKARASDSPSDSKTQGASSSSASKARASDSSSDSKTQGASSSSASKARAADSSSDSKAQDEESPSDFEAEDAGAQDEEPPSDSEADDASDSKVADDAMMDLGPESLRTKPVGDRPSFPPTSEPGPDWTSEDCFYELKASVESFPAEGFFRQVNKLCKKFPKWRERLVLNDLKAFALFIVHEFERRTGTWRKWCIKTIKKSATVPGGFWFRLVCSSNGWAKPKPAVAPPGKKQRNRKSTKCGCKRSAILAKGFKIRDNHVCEHQLPANHTKSLEVVRGMMGTESKRALWEKLEGFWQTSPDAAFLRRFLRKTLPDVDSYVIQQYIEELQRQYKHVQVDIDALVRKLENDGIAMMITERVKETGALRMSAIVWRKHEWHSPKASIIFLIDGAASIICRGYTAIPILGIDQEFGIRLVAMTLADSESLASVQLALNLLAKADPGIWNRETFWMSDEASGIEAALRSTHLREYVYHRFCRLHKAANLLKNLNEKGNAAAGDDKDVRIEVENLLKEMEDVTLLLSRERLTRCKVVGGDRFITKTFSRSADCYPSPIDTGADHMSSADWLNYLRTAPSAEHLLASLKEFATTIKKKNYVLFLWNTRDRWALCSMPLKPEFGIGTNNHSESYVHTMRNLVRHGADIDEFVEVINASARHKTPFSKMTAAMLMDNGQNMQTLRDLRLEMAPNLSKLMSHFERTRVTTIGQKMMLLNARAARGLDVERRKLKVRQFALSSSERKSVVLYSAFGTRFIKLFDLFCGSGSFRLLEIKQVVDRGKKGTDTLVFFVMICEYGSYVCSCGYPTYFGGLLCPHLIACFEAGFMSFHAVYNLHPFFITAQTDCVDFSGRSNAFSSEPCVCHSKATTKGKLRKVSSEARWNVFDQWPDIWKGEASIMYLIEHPDGVEYQRCGRMESLTDDEDDRPNFGAVNGRSVDKDGAGSDDDCDEEREGQEDERDVATEGNNDAGMDLENADRRDESGSREAGEGFDNRDPQSDYQEIAGAEGVDRHGDGGSCEQNPEEDEYNVVANDDEGLYLGESPNSVVNSKRDDGLDTSAVSQVANNCSKALSPSNDEYTVVPSRTGIADDAGEEMIVGSQPDDAVSIDPLRPWKTIWHLLMDRKTDDVVFLAQLQRYVCEFLRRPQPENPPAFETMKSLLTECRSGSMKHFQRDVTEPFEAHFRSQQVMSTRTVQNGEVVLSPRLRVRPNKRQWKSSPINTCVGNIKKSRHGTSRNAKPSAPTGTDDSNDSPSRIQEPQSPTRAVPVPALDNQKDTISKRYQASQVKKKSGDATGSGESRRSGRLKGREKDDYAKLNSKGKGTSK